MPTITAGRLDDADKIHSYDDIVAAHRQLSDKTASGGGDSSTYSVAAARITRLGQLYRQPDVLTDEMRKGAETALAAIRAAIRKTQQGTGDRFVSADTWLDHLSLLVQRPDDGR